MVVERGRRLGGVLLMTVMLVCSARARDSSQADTALVDSLAVPKLTIVDGGPVFLAAEIKPRRSTKPLTVGDRFKVEVRVRRPRTLTVYDPLPESTGQFVVTDRAVKTRIEGDTAVDLHEIEVAAFAAGELKLPRFLAAWPEEAGLSAAASESLALSVKSVMPEGMEDINDIKPQIPFPDLLPLWLALAVVAAAGIGILAWRLLRRWHRRRLAAAPLPEAWEEALAALAAIPVDDWLGRGLIKRYYYAVSEILKRYLTRRYAFPAIDQTTSELTLELKRQRVPERDEFVGFFRRADLAKYAKLVPPKTEMVAAVTVARDLVERTTPRSDPAAADTEAAGGES